MRIEIDTRGTNYYYGINTLILVLISQREVFKAREKKSPKKFVAMKKVLMENEKEGVSDYFLQFQLLFPCYLSSSS